MFMSQWSGLIYKILSTAQNVTFNTGYFTEQEYKNYATAKLAVGKISICGFGLWVIVIIISAQFNHGGAIV